MRTAALLMAGLLLAGCFGDDDGDDDGAGSPTPTGTGTATGAPGGNGTGGGAGPAAATHEASLSFTQFTVGQRTNQGENCVTVTGGTGITGGNLTLEWTPAAPTADQLYVQIVGESGGHNEATPAAPSPLTYELGTLPDDTYFFAVQVSSTGAAVQQQAVLDLNILHTGQAPQMSTQSCTFA